MSDVASLLPSNSTSWETSHELTDAERWAGLDPQVITRTKDALACEPQFLALLGWEKSVDLWFDDWSVEKKRYVVDKWFEFERLKGTPEGFRRFYGLVGGEVLKMTLPPQGVTLRHGASDAERQEWLEQFQQIRIYPRIPVAVNTRTMVLRHTAERSKLTIDRSAVTPSGGAIRGHVREARLFDPATGEETVLTRREVAREVTSVGTLYEYEDVVLPVRFRAAFIGGSLHAGPLRRQGIASEKTVRVRIDRPNLVAVPSTIWTSTVPNGRLTNVYPELIRERVKLDGAVIGKCSTGHRTSMVLRPNRAFMYVYERFYVYDRERDRNISAGYPGSAIGRARLGMTPFTAHMKVRYPISGRASDLRMNAALNKTLRAHDPTIIEPLLMAARSAKAARDTIWLNTRTRRRLRFGDRISFSAPVKFGAMIDA